MLTVKSERENETECDVSLQCMPIVRSPYEQDVQLGGTVVLNCALHTQRYPSWQGPDGRVINYGGDDKFTHGNRFSWHEDKKRLEIKDVQESDAGMYVCFSSEGDVLTVDLFIRRKYCFISSIIFTIIILNSPNNITLCGTQVCQKRNRCSYLLESKANDL